MTSAERPVTETMAEDWAGSMGERWLAHLDRFEGMIAPVGRALMEHAGFRAGERVVDIGCGGGATSLEIARRVGPHGSVLGIDISPVLVEAAKGRARSAGTANLEFRCADAATASPEGHSFDRLFSRFGVMFFSDAHAAFGNLRRFLRGGGRADLGVWAPARENPWVVAMMGIIGRHIELPEPPPRAPGPFALDDPAYVRELLERAGFGSTKFETWSGEQLVGGRGATPDRAVGFVLDAMSFGHVLEESGSEVKERVRAELAQLFARHHRPEGIPMTGKAFFVSAVAV